MSFSILYIFVAAFLVRLIALNQSLWLDEATTANTVRSFSSIDILTRFSPTDFHPPLYYFFMKFWTSLFGYSEVALRMPSVIFSLIAGWVVYRTGKKIGNGSIGFWSAVFFLFNPLIIYYSQEARMYMMVTMWLTMAIYFYVDVIRSNGHSHVAIIALNVIFVLSLCTFYGSIFFIVALYGYLLVKRQLYKLVTLLPGTAIALLCLSPLLTAQLQHASTALSQISNWNLALGIPNMKNLLLIPIKFVTGRISFMPKVAYFALAGMSLLFIGFFTVKGASRKRWLLFLLVTPLILAFITSFWTPMLQYFRFIYLIPVLALLLGNGTRTFKWEKAVVCSIFFLFSVLYLFNSSFHREDWKHLLISVPESIPVYMIPSSSDAMKYYYPDYRLHNLLEIDTLSQQTKALYVIPYTAEIYGFNYRANLEKKAYSLKDQQDYRGVTLEYWVNK